MSKQNFIEGCLSGDVLLEDIDNYIEQWHNGTSDEEIYEFLGMTEEEYGIWVENDYMLKLILQSRELNVSINDLLQGNGTEKLVARAQSPEEAAMIKEWLQRTGRAKQ